ncbi:uncharacterized protein K02A2.6-like isoform X1 [Entelurus aequoreus]|uniref:uncharacterized protein K02A2.6-like isoform X1 n=1 Tax=Entelurus aequoreus TaxID=161455 RepID=UPI002B1DA57C|nr:uncharacterized protein K02A2.6-like isoform X1 [Entelurus aequoreus]
MATYGTVGEFVEGHEDWTEYEERLGHFFSANGITEEDKKRSILLSACGAKTYKLIRNLATPRKPGEIPYDDLVTLVGNHHNPKPSVIVQRFKFHSYFRRQGQSVANFVAELRQLSEHCDFGAVLDDMLRDRLVCGINNDATQRRLLGETPPLTFKKALEISQGMEMAANNAKDIQKGHGGAQTAAVHHVRRETGKHERKVECFRCGGGHYANDCKFKDVVCHACNKKGHLAKKCRSSKGKGKPGLGKMQQAQAATHHLDEEDKEAVCSFNMFGVETDEEPPEPYYATVTVGGQDIKFEIDSGATASVISEDTYRRTWGLNQPPIRPSKLKLRTYTGQPIPHLGVVYVDILAEGQKAKGRLVIAKGRGPSLLGRDVLRKIRLNWHEIKYASTTEVTLQRYSDVFKDELGTLKGMTVKLHVDPEATPRFFKPRAVPYAMKGKVEEELERLQKLGIIKPVQFSRWAAPIVPVLKEDKTARICGDYKVTVNQVSKLEEYPLPRIDDLFATLAGGKLFTKLDMSQAYQQLLLDEDSKEYVTINTHKGLFKYNRLVFGVASSPAIFQRTMDTLLQGIPHVAVYLDDILVTGATEVEHLANLEEVLKRLSEAGLRLKRSKCVFLAPSVTYLGHRITAQGLCPVEDKVRAIKEAPNPKCITELRSFLGMVNYYGKFLPDLSKVLAPLYKLLHNDTKWQWCEEQEAAFKEVKELLHSATLLVHYDPDKQITLSCDASPYGVGAVLSHVMEDGSEKPVGFASRTLTKAEQGYSQLDKEGLAIVFAVKRFHQYLYGRAFKIYTDHKPLMSLFSETKCIPPLASARIQRWALTLSAYQYAIEYRAGKDNANADALSRLPLPDTPAVTYVPPETVFSLEKLEETPVKASRIKQWTERDPVMSQVKTFLLQGWPSVIEGEELRPYTKRKTELSLQDGCIFWGARVIVPPPGRSQIVEEIHETHPGASRMKSLARSYVWWPGLDKDLEDKVKGCTQCQINQNMPPPAPLHPWEWPDRPWSRLHMDFAGPFKGQMFLLMVDAHSKWIEAHIMSNITAPTTIDKLRQVFAVHGLPDTLVTDNGPTFTSELFSEFMQQNGIHHIRTAPFHPASNGLAERAVQTVKEGLKRMTGDSLSTQLSRFLFKYRLTPQTTTGRTPAEMLMGRRPKSRLDLLRPDMKAKVQGKQEKQKERHDQHARERQLKPDDCVYVRNFSSNNNQQWLPGIILKRSGPVSYVVKLTDGRIFRRHQDHVRLRQDTGSETDSSTEFPGAGPTAVGVGSPESETRTEASVSSGEDGHSHTDIQTSPSLPTPDPPKSPTPAVSAGSPEVVRRSHRTRKPPDRLNV